MESKAKLQEIDKQGMRTKKSTVNLPLSQPIRKVPLPV